MELTSVIFAQVNVDMIQDQQMGSSKGRMLRRTVSVPSEGQFPDYQQEGNAKLGEFNLTAAPGYIDSLSPTGVHILIVILSLMLALSRGQKQEMWSNLQWGTVFPLLQLMLPSPGGSEYYFPKFNTVLVNRFILMLF